MTSTIEEAKRLRREAESSADSTMFHLDNLSQIVELLQHESDGAVGEELVTRVTAAETLQKLAEEDAYFVAKFTDSILRVLDEESHRRFASVESVVSEFEDRSRRVMKLLLEVLSQAVEYVHEPFEDDDTVELLLGLYEQDIEPTSIVRILSVVSSQAPEKVAPYVSPLADGLQSDDPDRRYYTIDTFDSIAVDGRIEHLTSRREQFIETLLESEGDSSNVTPREREAAARAVHSIAQVEPSVLVAVVPRLLSASPSLSHDASITLCELIRPVVPEFLRQNREDELISFVVAQLPEVPPDGRTQLLDAVSYVANKSPESVVPFIEEVGTYLGSETPSVVRAATDVLRHVAVPDRPDIVRPFTDEIIGNLSAEDEELQRSSVRILHVVTQNNATIFKPYLHTIQEAAQMEEGALSVALSEVALILELGTTGFDSQISPSKIDELQRTRSPQIIENYISAVQQSVSDWGPEELPSAREVLKMLRCASAEEEHQAALAFAALCSDDPEQVEPILPDVLSHSYTADRTFGLIGIGLVTFLQARPEATEVILKSFPTPLRTDNRRWAGTLVQLLGIAVQNRPDDVVDFVLTRSSDIRELLISERGILQLGYLSVVGALISENPDVGTEFIDAFSQLCDSEDQTSVSLAVRCLADVAEHNPEAVAPIADRVAPRLENSGSETQRFALEALATVCTRSSTDVDVVTLVEPHRDALLTLIEDKRLRIRFDALSLFMEYAMVDPAGASVGFEKLIERLYDRHDGVRFLSVTSIRHIIKSEETDIWWNSVTPHISPIVDLLEKRGSLAFGALQVLLYIAGIAPKNFLMDETVMETLTTILEEHPDQAANPWGSEIKNIEQIWTGFLAVLEQQDDQGRLPTGTEELVGRYDHEDLLDTVPSQDEEGSTTRAWEPEPLSDPSGEPAMNRAVDQIDEKLPAGERNTNEGLISSGAQSDGPNTAVAQAISQLNSDNQKQCQQALERIKSIATEVEVNLERDQADAIAHCLLHESLQSQELAVLALDAVDSGVSHAVLDRADALTGVLTESNEEPVHLAALRLLSKVALFHDPAVCVPHLDIIESKALSADDSGAVFSACMIVRELAEAGNQAVEGRDSILAAGFGEKYLASIASFSFSTYADSFETVSPETVHAAATVLEQPHAYKKRTVRHVLIGFGKVATNQHEVVSQYANEISNLVTDRYDMTDDIEHLSLVDLVILAAYDRGAVAPFASRIEPMLDSDDERHVKAAMSLLYVLAKDADEPLEVRISPVVDRIDSDEKQDISEKAAEFLALLVTHPVESVREDATEDLITQVDALTGALESAEEQEARWLLVTLGALSDRYSPTVAKRIDVIASHLDSDDDAVRQAAIQPLGNTIRYQPDVAVDHLESLSALLDDVEGEDARAAIQIMRAVADEDPDELVFCLGEILNPIGEVDSAVEGELIDICVDAIRDANSSLESSTVSVLLDAVAATERPGSIRTLCEGLQQVAHSAPNLLDPHIETIIEQAERPHGESSVVQTELLRLLSVLSRERPASVVGYMERVDGLLRQTGGESKLEAARVFTAVFEFEPRLGVEYVDSILSVLVDVDGSSLITEAIGQLQILCEHDSSVVTPHIKQVTPYLESDKTLQRRAAVMLMESLASTDPTEVASFGELVRDRLNDEDTDIAVFATRTIAHLIDAGVLVPTASDIDVLLTWTDDPALAHARMTAVRNTVHDTSAIERQIHDSLIAWTKHRTPEVATIALDTLCHLGTMTSLNPE